MDAFRFLSGRDLMRFVTGHFIIMCRAARKVRLFTRSEVVCFALRCHFSKRLHSVSMPFLCAVVLRARREAGETPYGGFYIASQD